MNLRSTLAALVLCASAASAQDLYDTTVLRTMHFTFHDANWWTLLQNNYQSQTNILADLQVEGIVYPNVGVRIRGNTSYFALPPGSQKVSLNVEMDFVDPNQTLMGETTLNLNNAFHDPTFCREVAFSNFLARYIPNGRANHVVVTLNGANWGVYANVQQWGKSVLRQWFEDEDGMRVKCPNSPNGPGLRYVGTNPANYSTYEIKDSGGLANPIGALIDICNAVTNGSQSNWETIDDVFAIDPSAWAAVLENLFSDDDSYVNKGCDFVLYRNPLDGRAHLEQTDGNESWTTPSWTATRNFSSSTKPVLSHVLAIPELRQRYLAHYRAALTEFDWTAFNAEFTAYRNLIDAAVQADPKKIYSYSHFQNNFTSTVNLGGSPPFGGNLIGLQEFVTTRLAVLGNDAELNATAPAISNVKHTPSHPMPWNPVWITAAVAPNPHAVAKVELFFRPGPARFQRATMRDDGLSGDGAAGDGVYGVLLPVAAQAGQTVPYYVAATSSNTYGSMSFLPVRTELRPLEVSYGFGGFGVRVTEYQYSGANGEFVELTNTTSTPISLAGWSLDDQSANPGTFDLSAAGTLAPGQSILVTDANPLAFSAAWGLSGVTVLGPNAVAPFGRNDQINVYDATGQLVERVDYGDQSYPGSIRAQDASGQPCNDFLGANDPYAWSLSFVGDPWGSVSSVGGDIGTPGSYAKVPCDLSEPIAFCSAKAGLVCGTPVISASGAPSATAASGFVLNAAPARSCRVGVFLYNTSQAAAAPFDGGFLCIAPMGLRRAGPTNSGGTAGNNCDGAFAIDMNTFARGLWSNPDCAGNPSGAPSNSPAAFLSTAGTNVYLQSWGRDSVATGSFLSAGVGWTVGP